MPRYSVFESDNGINVEIATPDLLGAACAAAWSRANTTRSYTFVVDNTTKETVEEYDLTLLAILNRTEEMIEID